VITRNLRHYSWGYKNGKVYLIEKADSFGTSEQVPKNEMILSMAMADSLSRAIIGFKNNYRIEQLKKIRLAYHKKTK
jgi:hypothetical protein